MSILYKTAEEYKPEALEKIETLGFMKAFESSNVEKIKKVERGEKNFHSIYVEGLYGSGKTFLMRKICSRLINETDHTIPVYFYLGSRPFNLRELVRVFIDDVSSYVERGTAGPSVVGARDRWANRVDALKKAYESQTARVAKGEDGTLFLIEFSRALNALGYYPFYIFDEFERILLTGEVLPARENVAEFAKFSAAAPGIVRGTAFQGAVAFATTARFSELISQAVKLGPDREMTIREIGKLLGVGEGLVSNPELYPLARQPVMDTFEKCVIFWDDVNLELLAKKFNLTIHVDAIRVLAKILPTPRAVISLASAMSEGEVVSREKLAEVLLPAFIRLRDRLEAERTPDSKPLITAMTRWHERLEELLRRGIVYIPLRNRELLKEIASAWGIQAPDEETAAQKVKGYLRDLYNIGVLEKTPREYMLDRHVFAYLLGIERLPQGESATLENIVRMIASNVQQRREKLRKERKKQEAGKKPGSALTH